MHPTTSYCASVVWVWVLRHFLSRSALSCWKRCFSPRERYESSLALDIHQVTGHETVGTRLIATVGIHGLVERNILHRVTEVHQ